MANDSSSSVPNAVSDAASAGRRQFLAALFPEGNGYVDLRGVKPATKTKSLRVRANDFERVEEFARQEGGTRNAYIGVACRISQDNGKLKNCGTLGALFVDLEFKDDGEHIVRQRLSEFEPPPSIIIASGGGLHAYWLLKTPLALQGGQEPLARGLLRALAMALKADLAAAEPARVLRLPGTLNHKYDPPRSVEIEHLDASMTYDFEAFEAVLRVVPEPKDVRPKRSLPSKISEGSRNEVLFKEGCDLRRKRLSESEIANALQRMNSERCDPPLGSQEVQQIAHNAARYSPPAPDHPLTEAGDAECYCAAVGDRVRFDHRRGRWLTFRSHFWEQDADGEIHRLALETMRARQRVALEIDDAMRRTAYQKWTSGGEARRRQENMLALARNLHPIADAGDSWDTDPWLLGAQNGVLDLRTGVLRPGRQDDRITMRVRVPFHSAAKCPLWEATLKEVLGGDDELMSYLQRALGYSLTGDVREEVFFLTWGSGRNGKGTIMNTIGSLLGNYADDLPMSALAQAERGGGIPNDLAKVAGKRFVTSSEQGGGTLRRLNEDRIKQLTGRDPLTARFLHQEFFTFTATLKLWLATNNKPRVRDDSDGFWSRVHLIPFTQSFAGREDKTLKDRLLDEASGILAWLVQGCLAWQKLGLHPPAVVKDATRDYRQENEPLASFYESRCVVAEGARVQALQLFTAYTKWCDQTDVPGSFRLNQRTFGENVKRRFPADPANTRHVIYSGVGLREDLLGEQPL